MDFVVVGFGFGALGVVLGFSLRDLGPWLRRIPRERELSGDESARRVAWGRACRAAGAAIAIAGGAVWLVAVVALLAGTSDRDGLLLVMGALALAVLGLVIWGASYVRRYHPRSPRPRPTPRAARAASASSGDERRAAWPAWSSSAPSPSVTQADESGSLQSPGTLQAPLVADHDDLIPEPASPPDAEDASAGHELPGASDDLQDDHSPAPAASARLGGATEPEEIAETPTAVPTDAEPERPASDGESAEGETSDAGDAPTVTLPSRAR